MPYIEIKKSRFYEFLKRALDIVFASILLITFSPVIVFVSLAIKLDSRGPILADTPERVGKNGTQFKMYKFRSMVENAHEILRENPKFAQLYNQYKKGSYKLKDDPRITKVGRFIRKHSLDEVPQLLNVLKGEMSLVGPRPFMEDQRKMYGVHIKTYIHVRPGMTGLWQVSGRNGTTFARRIGLDREYIQRWSLWLDIYILLRTIKIVFFEKNAY